MSQSYIKHSLLMTATDIQDDSYTDEELVAFIQAGYHHMTVILCPTVRTSHYKIRACAPTSFHRQ